MRMFDHLIISITAKLSYLIKNYHYLITGFSHTWLSFLKPPIPYAAVRPKTQPRPSGNPDILAEMLGTIRAQRHLNEKRCPTARLGSDPVVIMAILVG